MGDLEQEGLELTTTPPKVGKDEEDEEICDAAAMEVTQDGGYEKSEQNVA